MALTPAYFETDNVTGQEIKLVGSGGPLVSNSVWLASRAAELAAMGIAIDIRAFGGVVDGVCLNDVTTTDAVASSISSATANFSQADVGKICALLSYTDTGMSPTPRYGSITSVSDAGSAVATFNLSPGVLTSAIFVYGTDNDAAIDAAILAVDALPSKGDIYFPLGICCTSGVYTLPTGCGIRGAANNPCGGKAKDFTHWGSSLVLAKYSAGNFITHGNSAASDTRGARIADINIDCFNLATSCVVKGTNSRTARFTNSTFVRGRGDVISASPTSRIFLCSIIGGNNGNGVVLSGDSTFLYNIVTGAGNGFAAVKCYNAHDVQIAHNHIWKDADTYSLLGNAVWISQGEANTLAGSINITENKFDTSYGAHVKITVSGNAALRGISIAGNTGFQNNAVPDDTYPFIEINVASGSSIRGLNIQNNMGHGSWASSSEGEYTYFIDNSASAGNIYGSNVGGNTIDNCGGMYNAFTPDHDSGNITIAAAGTTLTKSTTT